MPPANYWMRTYLSHIAMTGLKAAIICKKHNYTTNPLSDERIFDAVNILLLMQNATGGYATCEKTRGWHFMEWFNASEVRWPYPLGEFRKLTLFSPALDLIAPKCRWSLFYIFIRAGVGILAKHFGFK